MGFFWSMQSVTSSGKHPIVFAKRNVPTPEYVTITVLDGLAAIRCADDMKLHHVICTASHQRQYIGPGVRRIEIKEGNIKGALYLPPGKVIMMGVGGGVVGGGGGYSEDILVGVWHTQKGGGGGGLCASTAHKRVS